MILFLKHGNHVAVHQTSVSHKTYYTLHAITSRKNEWYFTSSLTLTHSGRYYKACHSPLMVQLLGDVYNMICIYMYLYA